MNSPPRDDGELDRWIAKWYVPAYRAAFLILGSATDAEEAVQEAFLRMWRFRDAMPEGEGARPWLFRVVMNSCYSLARKEQREKSRRDELADADDVEDPTRRPEDLAITDELTRAVQAGMSRLPEHLRVPLVLRYYAGLSEKEIALAIHRRAGTVKSRLHEARRVLSADPELHAVISPIEDAR
ncbi:MAG: RNA polymerase sigma factor [Acidimicrobiales bacterium]